MPERWDDFKVSSTERQVVRALGSIGGATLVSRVVGFVRDIVVALVFGAGPVTDAFFVAFRIPNILRRLLAEGALSTAMIPVFSEYLVTRSRPEVLRMLRAVLALALVALGVAVLLGIATAPWIVKVIAPGIADDPARGGLAVLLTRVMFPYVVLVGLAALAAGALNAQGRFFVSALGPAVQNVGMIVAIPLLAWTRRSSRSRSGCCWAASARSSSSCRVSTGAGSSCCPHPSSVTPRSHDSSVCSCRRCSGWPRCR